MSNGNSYELPKGRQPIEVITSVQRRRRWAPAEKKLIVEESNEPQEGQLKISRGQGCTGPFRRAVRVSCRGY
jgi:transposase-like protein